MMMLATPFIILLLSGVGLATERPIIGIVTEELSPKDLQDAKSLIKVPYVRAVEQSGARVVPIFINRTQDYYRNILDSVNGVLFPGGGVYLNNQGGYADAGKIILDYTKQVNTDGVNFPILGVCLGLELMLYLEVNDYSILDYCNSTNVALPLKFKKNFHHSKLYYRVPSDIIEILQNLPVTFNYHKRCVTETLLKEHNLTSKWHVLTTSYDLDGKEFISSIEAKGLPVAGIQFHPEKSAFEWRPTEKIVHSHKAIHSARYFYDWLVNEARKNNHSFNNITEENQALIYNYCTSSIDRGSGYFEQIYYFN